MRISGGEFRGRTLSVPKSGAIRPTQDRVREALFSMLCSEIPGSVFLDLFAGTGAVGLEALSRGAAKAVFVECDRRHVEILAKNVSSLLGPGSPRAEVARADALAWTKSGGRRGFDICFADPPYALVAESGYAELLGALASGDVVRKGGLFAGEAGASRVDPAEVPGWELVRDRRYGAARICIWRRREDSGGRVV